MKRIIAGIRTNKTTGKAELYYDDELTDLQKIERDIKRVKNNIKLILKPYEV